MITKRMNKKVKWKKHLESDGMGGNEYLEPKDIKCKLKEKFKLIRNNKGEEVVSSFSLAVFEDVQPRDVVIYKEKEYTVMGIESAFDITENREYKKVYC
ncbi:TPA: hypothetical protein LA742_000720 [Clostridium botulinum]|nr:hypothetical protein [Clostridium botulinum]